MRVVITTEHHFYRTADGKIYSATYGGQYSFWERYLSVFDEVLVVARIKFSKTIQQSLERADGKRVQFYSIPDFVGPTKGLIILHKVWKYIQQITKEEKVFILRVPGVIGTLFYLQVKKKGKPFAVEIVGDPYDALGPKAFSSPWARLVRPLMVRALKMQCRDAIAAAYVTKEALQQRYPPGTPNHTHYSSVDIPSQVFEDTICLTSFRESSNHIKQIVFVGTLARLYKGQDILLKAFNNCIRNGLEIELLIIGDGSCRKYLENLASKLNIKRRVKFLGQLSHKEVFQEFRKADLFVLPSRQEGLPRAMIEAMACGLPCIGSTVGGIPELLPPEVLIPPGDVKALSRKINDVISDPDWMHRMAEQNIKTSQDYHPKVLQARRNVFYQLIRDLVERKYNQTTIR